MLVFLLINTICFAQASSDAFIGTWIYQNNDTIFKIKLQKGKITNSLIPQKDESVWGGYYLSINDNIKEDYIKIMPINQPNGAYYPASNIYIRAWCYTSDYLGFTFYDQRIKHINGEGIGGGGMRLLTPTTLRWTLDEEYGLWHAVEGSEDADKYTLQGFSVPIDVIMTKEVEDIELDSEGLRPFE